MGLGHEKLDVYRLALKYVAWVYEKAVMLSRLGGRGYCVKENCSSYGTGQFDSDLDSDSDFDFDETKSQHHADAPDAHSPSR